MGKAADNGGAKSRLELTQTRPIYQPSDDLAHVIDLARIGRDNAIEFIRRIERVLRRGDREGQRARLHASPIG